MCAVLPAPELPERDARVFRTEPCTYHTTQTLHRTKDTLAPHARCPTAFFPRTHVRPHTFPLRCPARTAFGARIRVSLIWPICASHVVFARHTRLASASAPYQHYIIQNKVSHTHTHTHQCAGRSRVCVCLANTSVCVCVCERRQRGHANHFVEVGLYIIAHTHNDAGAARSWGARVRKIDTYYQERYALAFRTCVRC